MYIYKFVDFFKVIRTKNYSLTHEEIISSNIKQRRLLV